MKRIALSRSFCLPVLFSFCLLALNGFGTKQCIAQDEVRSWVDATGNFKIEASFVGMEGTQVVLKKPDGKTIKLAIDKLSEADKKWINESGAMENPFAGPPGDPQAQNNTKPQSTPRIGKRGEVEADTSDAVEIGNKSVSDWSLTPDAAVPPPAYATKIDITMPDNRPGVATQAAMSRSGELAVFSTGASAFYNYTVVNLSTGSVLGTAGMESYSAPDVHEVAPDGMNMICRSRSWGKYSGIDVRIVELRNGKPQERISWFCHSKTDKNGALQGDGRALEYCRFVDNEHLITCNKAGIIALWDFRFAKLVWWFNSEGPVIPATSANGKYLVTIRNDRLIVIDIAAGTIVATKAVKSQGLQVLAISPDGTKIAGAGGVRVRVWDFLTGTEQFESEYPGSTVMRMYWPDNRYFVIGSFSTSMVFDSELQIPVTQFTTDMGADFLIDGNGNVWYWNPGESKKVHLIPMIRSATQAKMEGKTAADFVVLPAGGSVRVEYNFQNYKKEIEDSIRSNTERVLTEAGFKVSSSASKVMRVFAGIGDHFQDESGRTGRKIDFALPRFRHSKTQFFTIALFDENDQPVWHSPMSDAGDENLDNGNYFRYLQLTSQLRRTDHLSFAAESIENTLTSDSPFGGGGIRNPGFGRDGFGGTRRPGFPGGFDKNDDDGDDDGDR